MEQARHAASTKRHSRHEPQNRRKRKPVFLRMMGVLLVAGAALACFGLWRFQTPGIVLGPFEDEPSTAESVSPPEPEPQPVTTTLRFSATGDNLIHAPIYKQAASRAAEGQCPTSVAGALPGVGREATLYTVMSVTENDISLYGFATEEQQSCFELLTAVSGVGPKVGLAILSVMEPDRVALAISAGDHKAFKAASGVGPKLAQRIVLELKDKVAKGFVDGINLEDVGAATAAPAAQGAGQAIAALVSLGYSQSEAALAVSKIDASLPVEEIIKLALRGMAGRR